MKRYALFVYDDYYPSGGWNDFKGSYDKIEEAIDNGTGADNWQVIDLTTGKEVA